MSRLGVMLTSVVVFFAPGPSAFGQTANDRLALKGYDPVAYFTDKRPTLGSAEYQLDWDGAIYRFASAEHRGLFANDPDRYLPQYNSWCAASVAKGEKVRPNPEYWLVLDGKLYLFGKSIGPGLMRADPVGMKRKADGKWSAVSKLPDPPRD
jgi:YHS domain-containing protein